MIMQLLFVAVVIAAIFAGYGIARDLGGNTAQSAGRGLNRMFSTRSGRLTILVLWWAWSVWQVVTGPDTLWKISRAVVRTNYRWTNPDSDQAAWAICALVLSGLIFILVKFTPNSHSSTTGGNAAGH